MSLNAATIEILLAKGMTGDDLLLIARAMETRKVDPTNAERQARHRIKKGRNAVTVTRYPPNDINSNPQEVIPQDAKASLPQGANRLEAVVWRCPDGVEANHWKDFLSNRKRKRAAKTQTALDGQLAAIAEFSDDNWPPGRLVQHAAAKGWASICDPRTPSQFKPREFNNGRPQQETTGIGRTERAAGAAFSTITGSNSRNARSDNSGVRLLSDASGTKRNVD